MTVEKNDYIGIDVGATNIKYIRIDGSGERLSSGIASTDTSSYSRLLLQIGEIAGSLSGKTKPCISGIGIIFAGFIDIKDRKIISSPNLKILDNRPVWKDLEKKLSTDKFVIDNDANGAAYGEFGFRRITEPDLKHLIFLTLGSGVGGGVIIEGNLLHGSNGFGAELGHIKLYDNGRICGCGATGCAEAYIGNNGIVETFTELAGGMEYVGSEKKHYAKDLSAKKIAELAEAGFPPALEAMDITGKRLGQLISILINIFNPQIIAIGGGIMNGPDLLLPSALEEARKKTINCAFETARIEKAILGSEAGAYGAAALARDTFM
jgi:glucokinase